MLLEWCEDSSCCQIEGMTNVRNYALVGAASPLGHVLPLWVCTSTPCYEYSSPPPMGISEGSPICVGMKSAYGYGFPCGYGVYPWVWGALWVWGLPIGIGPPLDMGYT